MPKYEVQICRVEHTIYCVEVEADNEIDAAELAYERYDEDDYDAVKNSVYGEDFVHDIREI